MSESSTTLSNKALRGIKRTCPSCAVRFYDLARDPIVCPSCGVGYTPEAEPMIVLPLAEKPGRRGKPFNRARPAAPVESAQPTDESEVPAVEDIAEAASAEPDDDVILEHEPDDAAVEDLIEHDITEEPKDR